MTISMAWAPGVIARPGYYVTIKRFFGSNWIFLVPILTLIGMYSLWSAGGARSGTFGGDTSIQAARWHDTR